MVKIIFKSWKFHVGKNVELWVRTIRWVRLDDVFSFVEPNLVCANCIVVIIWGWFVFVWGLQTGVTAATGWICGATTTPLFTPLFTLQATMPTKIMIMKEWFLIAIRPLEKCLTTKRRSIWRTWKSSPIVEGRHTFPSRFDRLEDLCVRVERLGYLAVIQLVHLITTVLWPQDFHLALLANSVGNLNHFRKIN